MHFSVAVPRGPAQLKAMLEFPVVSSMAPAPPSGPLFCVMSPMPPEWMGPAAPDPLISVIPPPYIFAAWVTRSVTFPPVMTRCPPKFPPLPPVSVTLPPNPSCPGAEPPLKVSPPAIGAPW